MWTIKTNDMRLTTQFDGHIGEGLPVNVRYKYTTIDGQDEGKINIERVVDGDYNILMSLNYGQIEQLKSDIFEDMMEDN